MAEKRVLIIDDNPDLAENLAEILADESIDVVIATGGVQGLSILREDGPFDLVITDMRMPHLSGLDVVRYIHEHRPGLPVVVLTAYARDELLEQAQVAGALSIFTKPADLDALTGFARNIATGETHLLVVEDDSAQRTNIVEIVTSGAPHVIPHPAADAAQAMRVAEQLQIHAAVVDVSLPDLSGTELAAKLRARFGPELPVLVVTGYRAEWAQALQEFLSAPGVELLEKPIDVDAFVAMVHRITRGAQGMRTSERPRV